MKRFSRLDYAAKVLKATGPIITKYKDFRSGNTTLTTTPQPREGSVKVAVRSFSFLAATVADAKIYAVTITGRANNQLTANGLTDTNLGHRDSDTANTSSAGFSPAKLIVNVVNSGSISSPLSQITGLEYKKPAAESYTIPFGVVEADAASEGQYEAYIRLSGQVTGVAPTANIARRVSFRPEQFKLR